MRPSAVTLDVDLDIIGESSATGASPRKAGAKPTEAESDEEPEEMATGPGQKEEKADRMFQAVDAACSGVLFIRFRVDTESDAFVLRLFGHMETCPIAESEAIKQSLHHCLRLLPMSHVMPANLIDIKSHIDAFLPQEMERHAATLASATGRTPTLACVTELRNNLNVKSSDVRETVLTCVPGVSNAKDREDKTWGVDLKNPDLVLFTSVFKSVAGFATLKDYYKYKRYNVQMIENKGETATTSGVGEIID
ncbi:THUMP domain-containing protein 1 [Thoreauomyces humboldtii]|nr:THUMP domain-containing protein 1 [Thoreauomyces humboldtii]